MTKVIILALVFMTSACAHKRVVMKDCEPVSEPFWVCVDQ